MRLLKLIMVSFLSVSLAACATRGQNAYTESEVGQSVRVEFGQVVAKRAVEINGDNSSVGLTSGAIAGAVGGSAIGDGSGQVYATIGGAALGALTGLFAEKAIRHREGIEYTITDSKGVTRSIVQEASDTDKTINVGDRVMIQLSGAYERVVPASQMPQSIQRPKGIAVVD